MAAKIGFADPRPVLIILVGQLGHDDIGIDPARLNRATRRGVIARRGQPQRRLLAGLDDGLDRALAEALFAHHQRAAVVLQRAGDDFRGRCGAGIDQHDHRQAVRHVARPRIITLDVILVAAALGDDFAAFEEGIADVDRLVEQTPGVRAQIDDIAQWPPAGRLVDRQQGRLGLVRDIAREAVDVDDPDAVLNLPFDRAKLDPLAVHGELERLVAAGADQRQLDPGSGIAAHLFDRFVERQAVHQLAVDVGDVIARLDPRAPRRRVLGRGNHLYRSVLDRHGQAEPAIIAVGGGPQLVEIIGFDIG